ncbi:MAG: hypothetical protein ACFFAE_09230 [Candidatus Hodarchaeota archaeon]
MRCILCTSAMEVSQELSSYLEDIRQKPKSTEIEGFVIEFLTIWDFIHQKAPSMSLLDIKNLAENILDTITLPFYQKFSDLEIVQRYEGWLKELSSIVINWTGRGMIMFPLRLITYEVVSHSDNAFNFYLQKLRTGEMKGTVEELFNLLFPKLINVCVPLSETDLQLLKSFQRLQNSQSLGYLRLAKTEEFASHLDVSMRTVQRRLHLLRHLQVPIGMHFLDLGKLGYETLLLSHFNPIPEHLVKYTLLSVDLVISTFSLFQIPTSNTQIFIEIQDLLEPSIFQQMSHRNQSWNLSGLAPGPLSWNSPPPFLHNDLSVKVVAPSPTLDLSLKPEFDLFRKLTPADIKILDFITIKGKFSNVKHLSQAVNVSAPEVSRRMEEYQKNNLIFKIFQFFNIGLDLSPTFCISCPKKYDISWLDHLFAFPKTDIFYHVDDESLLFFGHLKLPSKWVKAFTRKIRQIKTEFSDIKFYYTLEPPNIAKWNISLADTYS